MKKTFAITMFMLAALTWTMAQQPATDPGQSSAQTTSQSSQMPNSTGDQATPSASQTPSTSSGQATSPSSPSSQTPGAQMPGSATSPTAGASPTITAGCLGGSNPNYTITDASGNTYKLNIPPNADTSKLAAHVGESVNVAGNVNGTSSTGSSSIDVSGIGKGTGTCPAGGAMSPQTPPKQ
jgi:hypothetical protein